MLCFVARNVGGCGKNFHIHMELVAAVGLVGFRTFRMIRVIDVYRGHGVSQGLTICFLVENIMESFLFP